MGWEVFIPLIIKYGLPLAEAIWKKTTTGQPPTAADWSELNALDQVREEDLLKARLAAAGIPLDDPKAQALLALVKASSP